MNYVIIGNSAAGIGAVEAIRKIDKFNPITIITEEDYIAYSRPLIAEYLSDTIELDKMWYRREGFYSDNNVDLKLNTTVKNIDILAKKVITDDLNEISYDKLLVATGGTPIIPSIQGLNLEGVFTFVRWDEVKKIKEYKENIKSAVVIGGGLIGLKAAEHLTKAGVKVTLVELAPRLLSTVLDNTASDLLKSQFEENGVTVYTENTVEEVISDNNKVNGALLKDGKKIDCDAIVVAIGVRPNMDIVNNTSISIDRGIIINEFCQTNNLDVYAAGDVAQGLDILLEENRVLPIWPVAYRQGYVAGLNMAGQNKIYEGYFSMNSLEFFHLPIISAGFATLEEDSEEKAILNTKNKVYKKVIIKDNKLVGFTCISNIDRAGIFTSLIRDKTNVESFQEDLLKDDFGLIYISKEIREEKFAYVTNI